MGFMRDSIVLFEYCYKFSEDIKRKKFIDDYLKKVTNIFFFEKDKKIKYLKDSEITFEFFIEKIYSLDRKEIFFYLRIFCFDIYFDNQNKYGILLKLRNILRKRFINEFKNVKFCILKDEIAKRQLQKSYPIIFEIENSMRELIVKLMNFKGKQNWFDKEVPDKIIQSIKPDRKDLGVYSLDFSHLSSFLFERNETSNIDKLISNLEKLKNCNQEDLEKIKKLIPKSNWEKYFNNIELTDNSKILSYEEIQEILEKLERYRNSVAHNNLYIDNEFYIELKTCADKILSWINNALYHIEYESRKYSDRKINEYLGKNEKELLLKIDSLINEIINKYKENDLKIIESQLIKELNEFEGKKEIEDIKYFITLKQIILDEMKEITDDELEKYKRDINDLISNLNNILELKKDIEDNQEVLEEF